MSGWDPRTDTSPEMFHALAQDAYEALPEMFREKCGDLRFVIQDYADEETLEQMEMDHPMNLLGLYHGVDLTRRSVLQHARMPDTVYLFREPIIAYARHKNVSLGAAVNNVLVHEVGHHFGLSDEKMHALEDGED